MLARAGKKIRRVQVPPPGLITLAKPDGVGALQFSPALYESGPLPSPSSADLRSLALQFGESRGLGEPFDLGQFESRVSGAGASYCSEGDLVRVWYVSDGRNIMLVTYVCDWEDRDREMSECEEMLKTIRFVFQPSSEPEP